MTDSIYKDWPIYIAGHDTGVSTSPRISRHRAPQNRWTFTIPPVQELLSRYVANNGINWVDPFAGRNSPAAFSNDLSPESKAAWHMDALEFCKMIGPASGLFNGVLFDPPYSYRQISDCYKEFGLHASSLDTSENFYNRVMNAICDYILPGGYAISFGWNSNGFGFNRGFIPVEYMMIAHGGHHYDTLVVVEQRMDVPCAKTRKSALDEMVQVSEDAGLYDISLEDARRISERK